MQGKLDEFIEALQRSDMEERLREAGLEDSD